MKDSSVKFLIGIVLIALGLEGCHKEQIVLESPSITIESAKPLSLTNYEIVVKIVTGEGQELQKAEIVFDDITVFSAS